MNRLKRISSVILAMMVAFSMMTVGSFGADNEEVVVDTGVPAAEESQDNKDNVTSPVLETEISMKAATDSSITVNWTGEKASYKITVFEGVTPVLTEDGVVGNEYTATGLNPAKGYKFMVEAEGAKKTSDVYYCAASVTGLKLYSAYTTVTLEWNPVNEADKYFVYRSTSQDGEYKLVKDDVTNDNVQLVDVDGVSTNKVRCSVDSGINQTTKQAQIYYYHVYAVKNGVPVTTTLETVSGGRVSSITYTIKFKTKWTLKCHCSACKKKVKHTFAKGTEVTAVAYGGAKYKFDYNGHRYYLARIRATKQVANYTKDWDYDETSAELFVNEKGLSSPTNYLVWANLYTQRVYVFYNKGGAAGGWKLVNSFPCGSGKATTPSPYSTGDKKIGKKLKKYHNRVYWSTFSSMNSFHGRKKNDPDLGGLQSHGCIRIADDTAYYVWKNVPLKSRVLVY